MSSANRAHSMGTFGGKGMAMATRRLLAAAILAAGSAAASDRPHYPEPAVPVPAFPANTCAACHKPHGASGAGLTTDPSNANLCVSCHTSKSPGTGIGTWQTTDQASPGTSGSSHNYSAAGAGTTNPRVATYNITAPPASSTVKLAAGNLLDCSTCHDQHSQLLPPADPNAPPYPADATVTEARRHYQTMTNSTAEMCVECHTGWKQSTVTSATWVGTTPSGYRSHPVVDKDNLATPTKLIMNAAGTGTSDRTYKQVPHDMPMRAKVPTTPASTTTVIQLDPLLFKLAPNALQNFVVRFTSGGSKNVAALVASNTASTITLAAALGAAPAAGTVIEIDRVSYGYYEVDWDVATSNTGTTIADSTKSWANPGANTSPTTGAGLVTILASGPTGSADVGKVCTISNNNANTLTLTGCTLAVQSGTLPNALVYRINWKAAGSGTTTGAGTTTTFVDGNKTLLAGNGPVGLQVRFLASNATARITAWAPATGTATFAPALAAATTANMAYQLEPAQVGPFAGAVVSGSTTGGFTTATNLFGAGASNNAQNTLLRFTSGTHRGEVTKILTNGPSNVTFTTVAGTAPAVGDTFEIDLDGNSTNNAWLGGTAPTFSNPATGQVTCMSCHGAHYADSDAGTYDDVGRPGDGHLLRRGWNSGATDEVCGACHATQIHSSLTVGSKYGAWGTANTCTTCHQPHLTGNVLLVKPTITRPDSTATVAIDFRDAANGQAPNAMVNGPLTQPTAPFYTSGNGPCEACHTQTRNGLLYIPGVAPLGTGNVTVSGTTVTCSGTCAFNGLVTAAGWEFKMAADPATSWTRVSSATATTMTLAVTYPRTVATAAAYEIANPRFRGASAQRGTGATAGSGRGVNAGDHPTAACTNCHSHSTGFKASCTSCHGTEGRASPVSHAPPKDSLGNLTATGGTAPNRVGAHLAHLGQKGTGAISNGVPCASCHLDPPARADHPPAAVPNPVRRALLTWGPLATAKLNTGDPTPVPAVTQSAGAVATCSATFCHGNFKNGNLTNTVSWDATIRCGSCHGVAGTTPATDNPTPGGTHPQYTLASGQNCNGCHPGYNYVLGTGPQGTGTGVDPVVHIDGKLDGGGDCTGCHAIAQGGRRAIVPEFKNAWSHKRSSSGGVPANTVVTKWDCVPCHMEASATTGDPDPAYHPMTAGGVIDLRDPDTGQHVKQVTFTAASGTNNAGGYATTTVDMTFTRFSRNLAVPLESDPSFLVLGAIMTNQCLKCHDADGALSPLAQVPTPIMPNASAGKPFGTTIAGAGYVATTLHTACKTAGANNDGCVVDVNTDLATTNSSYHPVRGKQNNSYVTATRLNAPWTGITKTAGTTTNWGYLISCWDCHAPDGTASTVSLTSTVTAHGGATTVRGAVWSTTSPLCKTCHIAFTSGNAHGVGSAFNSSVDSGMNTYIQNQCHHCHSSTSTASKPARPVPGQDTHGFNAFTSAMAATGDNLWPVGTTNTWRPYAFMRSAGTSGTWRTSGVYTRPRSGIDLPVLTTGNCSGNPGGTNCSNTMGTYSPGGVY